WSLCEVSICYSYLREGELALEAALKAVSILEAGAMRRLTVEQRRETTTHVLQAKAFALYSCGRYVEAIESARAALAMWGADQTQNQICSYSLHTIALAHAALLDYRSAKAEWHK